MTRRDAVQLLLGLIPLLSGNPALANDSADSSSDSASSSAGSGDSSAGSVGTSQDSADASNGSAESSQASGDSSANSGADSGAASADSSAQTTVAALTVGLSLSSVVGAIVVVAVLLNRAGGQQRPRERTPAQALLLGGLIEAQRDLGLRLSLLVDSPSELDRLVAAARAGAGAPLDALAGAAGVSRARAAEAVNRRWVPTASRQEAARVVAKILFDLAPEVQADATVASAWLWRLAREIAADPATPRPAHARLAAWMGVRPEDALAASAATLGTTPSRVALLSQPDTQIDRLAAAFSLRFPAQVAGRVAWLTARAEGLESALDLALVEPV